MDEKDAEMYKDEEIYSKEKRDLNLALQNSQMKWIFFLMVGLIIIIVGIPFIITNFINNFDYQGLTFQKTKLGDLTFYSTQFPVMGPTGNAVGTYEVNLRNDPRDLAKIPVTTRDNKIYFAIDRNKYGTAYISLNPFMEMCEGDTVIAMATLSGFLKDSGFAVVPAYTDKAYAAQHGALSRWCHDDGFDTVFVVTDGNETAINELGPSCYELQFKNCEVIDVSERVILSVLEEYARKYSLQ